MDNLWIIATVSMSISLGVWPLCICLTLRWIEKTFFLLVAPQHLVEYDIPHISTCQLCILHDIPGNMISFTAKRADQTQPKNLRTRHSNRTLQCMLDACRQDCEERACKHTDTKMSEIKGSSQMWASIEANYPLKISQPPHMYPRVSELNFER